MIALLLVIVVLTLSIIMLNYGYMISESRVTVKHINPIKPIKKGCETYCLDSTCKEYRKQLGYYLQCERCKDDGYCIAPTHLPGKYKCVKCNDRRFKSPCHKLFGCDDYAPINPKFTKCKPCWKNE